MPEFRSGLFLAVNEGQDDVAVGVLSEVIPGASNNLMNVINDTGIRGLLRFVNRRERARVDSILEV